MALEDFFDHKCNIYHLNKITNRAQYGLPDDTKFEHSRIADYLEQRCHFSVKSGNMMIINDGPAHDLEANLKLTLPADVDIRVNDKVVDCSTGYEYEAGIPRNIRGHHIAVWLRRVHPKAL